MRKPNSRAAATDIIARWLGTGSFPDRQLHEVKDDRAFVTELVYGVVRRARSLEWLMQQFVSRKSPDYVEAALYVGIYQLCFMENVEEYAALNETVEAVKMNRAVQGATGLVNAVLRKVQAHRDSLLARLERQPDGIRLSHPDRLMKRWLRQYGERDTRQLCEWNNRPAETVLRVEPARIAPPDFIQALETAGIAAEPHPFPCDETFLILPRGVPVPKVPGYREGWFVVQDPATSVSVALLDPRPGECVLDACAAPGGKAAMMAGRMDGKGELTAMDVHDDRLDTLRDTLKRTGWDFVQIVQADAARGFPQTEKQFDAVLLDVPCTNTGVLRRRADARWRFSGDRLETMKKTQWQILTAMAKHVKPGGRMAYSTCSLEPEENEELLARWSREHGEFRLVKARRLFPPKSGTDGAYAALLCRAE